MNIKQQFSLFFENMADMVFLVEWKNHELWYTEVNPAAQQKLKIDMVGKRLVDVLPQSVYTLINENYLKCIETRQPVTYSDLNLFVADLPASETSLTFIEEDEKTFVLGITKTLNAQKKKAEDYIFLESLVENTVDAMLVIDTDGFILKINKAFVRQFGWNTCELIGKPLESLAVTPEDMKPQSWKTLALLKEAKSVPTEETIRLTKTGMAIHTSISYSPILNEDGKVVAISMIYRNIQHLKELEEKLEESHDAYKSLFSYHKSAVCMVDDEGVIQNTNDACMTITGYSKEEIIGYNIVKYANKVVPELDLDKTKRGKVANYELLFPDAKGRDLYLSVTNVPIIVKGITKGTYIIAQDITDKRIMEREREKLQEQLTFQAYHDSLTELPNRRMLKDKLEESLAEAEKNKAMLAVFFLDCDHLKEVNDTHGHEVGDDLLIAFSKRLLKCIRERDMVARLGGDEFVILLHDIDNLEQVDKVAERILTTLASPYTIQGHQIKVTSSIGVATYPANGTTAKQLFRKADQALYAAKKAGRNGYQVSGFSAVEK
ncbi:diguanylate cyclase domain-containing protein [Sutcliffiella horikoshii]|uniref:diguanylate cyclase domain-containing protein n=1 Tax=Sutcliffiella horikoshii TaxID=79883 RepID=UPI001F26A71C|nr:diguanylate cyclase [Sutcliffiella horikoshii]MCG1021527.1 sensor domain-containing diguanylate cyclase [Sutcliffiella horikoshii]